LNSPQAFDEEIYQALIGGLECSEVMLSELCSNKHFRIDSSYYSKKYIQIISNIKKFGYTKVNKLANQITDFGAFSQTNFIKFQDKGILFLRNQDINNGVVNTSSNAYISNEIYNKLTLHLQENDILIPRVGTLGDAAMIDKKLLPCAANQNLAVIRLNKLYNVKCFVIVMLSKIGKEQIIKSATGNVQPWLNLDGIGELLVPNFTNKFQKQIEESKISYDALILQADKSYTSAETSKTSRRQGKTQA